MSTLSDRIWDLKIPPGDKLLLLAVERMKASGEHLNMSRLAKFIRVDRTTVYRMAARLTANGLLEIPGHNGSFRVQA